MYQRMDPYKHVAFKKALPQWQLLYLLFQREHDRPDRMKYFRELWVSLTRLCSEVLEKALIASVGFISKLLWQHIHRFPMKLQHSLLLVNCSFKSIKAANYGYVCCKSD